MQVRANERTCTTSRTRRASRGCARAAGTAPFRLGKWISDAPGGWRAVGLRVRGGRIGRWSAGRRSRAGRASPCGEGRFFQATGTFLRAVGFIPHHAGSHSRRAGKFPVPHGVGPAARRGIPAPWKEKPAAHGDIPVARGNASPHAGRHPRRAWGKPLGIANSPRVARGSRRRTAHRHFAAEKHAVFEFGNQEGRKRGGSGCRKRRRTGALQNCRPTTATAGGGGTQAFHSALGTPHSAFPPTPTNLPQNSHA